jgi:hypothetical protein
MRVSCFKTQQYQLTPVFLVHEAQVHCFQAMEVVYACIVVINTWDVVQ